MYRSYIQTWFVKWKRGRQTDAGWNLRNSFHNTHPRLFPLLAGWHRFTGRGLIQLKTKVRAEPWLKGWRDQQGRGRKRTADKGSLCHLNQRKHTEVSPCIHLFQTAHFTLFIVTARCTPHFIFLRVRLFVATWGSDSIIAQAKTYTISTEAMNSTTCSFIELYWVRSCTLYSYTETSQTGQL